MASKFLRLTYLIIIFTGSIHCVGLQPNPKFKESSRENRNSISFESRLTQEIESYLGVPYRWGGTSRKGMDCSGLVGIVYRNVLGIQLPHSARMMFKQGKFIEEQELKIGDLVFFENIENYGVSHVGIYIGNHRFAHASTTKGVTISSLHERYYHNRFIGARKIISKNRNKY